MKTLVALLVVTTIFLIALVKYQQERFATEAINNSLKLMTNEAIIRTTNLNKTVDKAIMDITATPTSPRVIKKWVPGKPIRDCMGNSNELNENVIRCRNGYFTEEVLK